MSGPGLPPQLPPELMALMGGAPGPGGPGMPEPTSAGAEAANQSDIAAQGLAAWKAVQALNGQRPEGDMVKALIMYVLTEGQGAPQAQEIAAYLQSLGVQIPGIGPDAGPIPSANPKISIDDAEPE